MFPDVANVLFIRDALWRHKAMGSASIMVGAGFSRNADPVSTTARKMPSWSEMAEALCHPLYPLDDTRRKTALKEASCTSGFLRLAQEYQAAFGASSLNDCIRNLVPDTDYRPGDLHKRLLRLPWGDVFSTNWDTLLERTCTDVFDRSYDVVRAVREIPFTMRPRIVKLHGSFPAHEPFIFTEEEYRTYPMRFSPFVNLVQQSMMETIFCLVGFSGDDPNFLHWSGWVRDNLGAGALKIYLVGWLELSVHRRRMLEARNVMPVDLAALPGSDKWPPDLRHRYATEWFIAALEQGKRYGAVHWPSAPAPFPPPPPYLGVVPPGTDPTPRPEPFAPPAPVPARLSSGPSPQFPAKREQALRAAIQTWGYNRRLYPGWLVAPDHIRKTLFRSLQNWIWEFSLLQALSPLERLKALSELAWRTDRALFPFPSNFEEAAYAALAAIDCNLRTIDGTALPETEDWSDVLLGADTLALALSRNARYAGNRTRFDQALRFLIAQRDHDPEIRNAVEFEECLWSLATGDLAALLVRLDGWLPAHAETLWSLRKAGLLAEMKEDTRACTLLEFTLMEIRRARRRDIDDLVSLSLESWALFLALAYSERGLPERPVLPNDMPEPFERWRALGIVECDAFSDYQALERLVEANQPRQAEITKRQAFDLDHTGVTHHFAWGPSPSIIAAYQMTMLAEMTGIPPMARHSKLFEDGLSAAAKLLATDEQWLASQLAIRLELDGLLDDVFSRTRVARLPESLVETVRDTVLKRVEFGLARIKPTDIYRSDNVATVASAIEILSRVAVRLNPDQLRTLFDFTVSHYGTPLFRRMSIRLGLPVAHLLARILESLSRTEILKLLPSIFALPLPQEAGFSQFEHRWQDPASVVPDWLDGAEESVGPRASAWEGIVSHLLLAANGTNTVDRGAAVFRLAKLMRLGVLNEGEKRAFADALWTPSQLDKFGLPQHTNLPPWALLIMPEEHSGQARVALLRFIAERSQHQDGDFYKRLADIGELLRHFVALRIPIELPENVQAGLGMLIDTWANHRAKSRLEIAPILEVGERPEVDALNGVVAILQHVAVTGELINRLWGKADAMDIGSDGSVRAFALYPTLAAHCPEKAAELLDRLRRSLLSDQEEIARSAVFGLHAWISSRQVTSHQIEPGVDDLVREVGLGIAARRLAILRPALEFARWLFRDGPQDLRQLIVRDCDHGLTALLVEADYARSGQAFDIPGVRAASFLLASAMAASGFTQESGVTGWLGVAKNDPLPEVRNADLRRGP
jgi:hypothetical protein